MAKFDWQHVRDEKDAHRDRLVSQPFVEKLRTLERLRERTNALVGQKGRSVRAVRNDPQIGEQATQASAALSVGLFGASASMASIIAKGQLSNPPAVVSKAERRSGLDR